MKPMGTQIKIVSLSFLLIFFGFNGVQQYVTTFFSRAGIVEVGFQSLLLIYLFFILCNPLSALFVSRYGAKKSMVAGSLFYALFIFSLTLSSVPIIYGASALLGAAASFLWTGQGSYLIRASDENSYGKNMGFFWEVFFLGSALGVILIGFLIARFSFKLPFVLYSFFPLAGSVLLLTLQDIKPQENINHFQLLSRSLKSFTALRFSGLWFAVNFASGLAIGIIPLEIQRTLGISLVGILSSLFSVFPILFSLFFGSLSDTKGRKFAILLYYAISMCGFAVFLLSKQPIFLILGIVLLALGGTVIRPVSGALVGDISTKQNLEFLTGLFWMVQNIGVVSALAVSQIFQSSRSVIYLVSLFVTAISLVVLLPLLRLSLEQVKEKISKEVF